MSDAAEQQKPVPKRSRKAAGANATDDGHEDAPAKEPREPTTCIPCHGSGKVISNLGEQTRQVTCPWCRGGGVRLIGMDAQEWQQEQAALKR
jgi:DnaJ-class molecular chaperone